MSDLIERLRKNAPAATRPKVADVMDEAADYITTLEAKLAVAREALEEIEAATMSQFATVADLANWRGVRAEIAIQEIEQ